MNYEERKYVRCERAGAAEWHLDLARFAARVSVRALPISTKNNTPQRVTTHVLPHLVNY